MKQITTVNSYSSHPPPMLLSGNKLINEISIKIKSQQEITLNDIHELTESLSKSTTPVAKSNISDIIISIIDPSLPSRPNKDKNIFDVLINISRLDVVTNLRLKSDDFPKIAHYLSVKGLEQKTAIVLNLLSKHYKLPVNIAQSLKSYKDSLASDLARNKQLGHQFALEKAKKISSLIEVFNEQDTYSKSSVDILIEKLEFAKGIEHHNLGYLLLKQTKLRPPDKGLVYIARGLPYEDTKKTNSVLRVLKLIYTREKGAPQQVIDTLEKFGLIKKSEPKVIDEFKQAPQILVEQNKSKPSKEIIEEIQKINSTNYLLSDQLKLTFRVLINIDKIANNDSIILPQGTSINKWTAKQIFAWSKYWKHSHLKTKPSNDELLAVTKRAVILHKGYSPRDVQMISTLLLINKDDNLGRLLQVKTGEGKTVISAMTAVFFALTKQKPVDIITSSSVLAERDAKEQADFFALFGLSCSHVTKGDSNTTKDCYRADILYGYASDFEGDYLRDYFKGLNTRMSRAFAYAIVDEVDSMLLDEGAKITKLSSPRPGVEYLAPIFLLTWQAVSELNMTEEMLEDKGLFRTLCQKTEGKIISIINSGHFSFPNYLLDYIRSQIPNWAKSALRTTVMQENKHYVIAIDKDTEEQVIAPVDYTNSGVIQNKTNWDKGVHQFLQAKHNLKMHPEGLMTSFISNLSFFSMYKKNIMGMTGTLGSDESRSLLSSQYSLDTVVIPKFKHDLFKQEEALITDNKVLHRQAIITNAIEEASKGRVVLIICPDISFSKDCAESIIHAGYSSSKISIYSRNDLDETNVVERIQTSGEIIVATNLAGRGTDIKLTEEVNKAGGLHVILTSLSYNLRVEEQAFGRTARQGNPGSGKIIIDGNETSKLFGINYDKSNNISFYKRLRDLTEQQRINLVKEKKLVEVSFSDKLFNKFNDEVYTALRKRDSNHYLLEQLEENWGFWLKRQQDNMSSVIGRNRILRDFETFKSQQIEQYLSGRPTNNPIYQIQMAHGALGKDNSYDESIMLLEQVISADDPFIFAGHYYLAYAYLRKNLSGKAKDDPKLSTGAHRHLSIAKLYLEDVIIAQLQAIQLVLGTKSTGTPLARQINNKIELLNHQLNYINNAIQFLENNINGKRIITAGATKTFDQFYPPDKEPKSEIMELNRLGSLNLYTIDAKNPPQDVLSSVVVTIVGIGQTIFGTMLAIATAGQRGVGLIVGGIQDIYNGANSVLKGEGVDLGDYFKAKAIEIAIDLISDRIADKLSSSSKVINDPAKKLTTKQILKEVGIRVGTRLASEQLVKVTVKELTKHTLKKAIGGEIKKAVATIKARLGNPRIAEALENIYAIDCFYQGRYGRHLSTKVSDYLNKRTNELETIATALITSTLSKAVGKSGNTAGSVIINAASTGVEVARALDKIQDIADDFCDYMEHIILQLESSLPANRDILKRLVPSLSNEQVTAIENHLNNSGIFKGKWQIDGDLLGFKEGVDQITLIEGKKSDLNSRIEKFTFEDINKALNTTSESKSQEIDRRNLDEANFKVSYTLERIAIKKAVKQMHSTFAKRGQFAEPIIDSYCDTIASRMRGQIRSAVVAPIVSRISKPIFEAIEQEIVTNVLYPDRLEQQFLLENYRRAGFAGIGVAAGDYDEKDSGNLSDEDEEERWNLNQPAWYNADDSEFLSSVQIAQDNRRSSVTSNQDQNPVILQHNRSRVMFDGRGNPAVDRFIETVFSVFREKFNESQKESIRHRNISSSDLFTSNNQEINRDVAAIRRGKGPAIFKAFNEFNATTFGTTRYLLEQVSHIAHLTAPDGKAIIDASLGTVGHGINELWIKLPDKYTNFIENNYQDFMGSNFPTRNLSFAVEFPASLLVGQMGGSVLKLSLKPKTNSSAVTPISRALDNKMIPMQQIHTGVFSSQITHRAVKEVLGDRTIIKGSTRELAALEIKTILQQDGKIMAGGGHIGPIKDIKRLVNTYGGGEIDWVKKSTIDLNKRRLMDGNHVIELHWYENIKNGQKVEPKIKKTLKRI